ncbi:hypothetical protein PY650_24115 [Rhizobium calliandrae]|uniref:Uncharacterized protein n=1 Tax=Rhizobium calliandrae TaxID=1312182 RepID=A0ABT7KJ52_9HYPH|nr:hypothetical protein [Rhizobium calliandrae]MDL2408672.1 hypothetical protein [Rhizobium calliandrae]
MNDLCVIWAAAIVCTGLGAGGVGAYEFRSERVIFADPIRALEPVDGGSATRRLALPPVINGAKTDNDRGVFRDRATGSILESQYVRKRFIWPWASSPTQDSPIGETQRGRGNRSGGSGSSGSSGSSNAGASSAGSSGNMGGGSSTGNSGGGNMGGSGSGGSGSGSMK